jgi:hypothetical protein
MSTSDRLLITSDLEPKPTLQLFAKILDINDEIQAKQPTPLNLVFSVRGQGWTAYSSDFTKLTLSKSFIESQLGIIPTVEIRIRFDRSADIIAIRFELLNAVLEVVNQTQWDVALIHYDSKVMLLRRAGRLILKKDELYWTQEWLKTVKQRYTMEAIPEL